MGELGKLSVPLSPLLRIRRTAQTLVFRIGLLRVVVSLQRKVLVLGEGCLHRVGSVVKMIRGYIESNVL